MPFQKAKFLVAVLLTQLIFSSVLPNVVAQSQKVTRIKPVTVIKVGITEYSKIQRTYRNYQRLFGELAAVADPNEPVTFEFAVGTYGEVLDWYNKRLIDVAVLSAMPMGELLLAGDAANLQRSYIGDLSVTPADSKNSLLSLFSDRPVDPHLYRTGCIILRADKELEAIADSPDPFLGMKKLWELGKLNFLFVRPYSLSGYIAPVRMLKNRGIDPVSPDRQNQIDFTYDHSESLERMIKSQTPAADGKPPVHLVAFVLDDTRFKSAEKYGSPESVFRRIRVPELDKFTIPREIVLANYHQEGDEVRDGGNKFTRTKALVEKLFASWVSRIETTKTKLATTDAPHLRFRSRPGSWQETYKDVKDALENFSLPKELLLKSTLNDLLADLLNTNSPRLALVLSGGGAKCAYQAGAIVEIEKKLKQKVNEQVNELRRNGVPEDAIAKEREAMSEKLKISLVVGTSGGAINALLVALGVTEHPRAASELGSAWQSFKQQQFLRPSLRFRVLFGVGFGIFQTLLIAVAVLLFGRQTMNWPATLAVLVLIGLLQLAAAYYFQISKLTTLALLAAETLLILIVIGIVFIFDRLIAYWDPRLRNSAKSSNAPAATPEESSSAAVAHSLHWRRLTIVLLLIFGLVEALVAWVPGIENLADKLPDNHWIEHSWTGALLLSNWSYPFPLLIGIVMALVGWKVMRGFDWNARRESFVWWIAIALVVIAGLLVMEGLFKESSPSKAEGIEEVFVDKVPEVIRNTVRHDFAYAPHGSLKALSEKIMADRLLQRDLVITSSKLPVAQTNPAVSAKRVDVNSLPDDLYFYYRHNTDDGLKPPPDKSFVPLKYNHDKLLDVVIGSSTIYPIFPSRRLVDVNLGNEGSQLGRIDLMRIIDGGFIHNIPIEAARLWKATHIIVIEASPAPQQRDPQYFWEHALTAFGYLFSQAQRTDMVAQGDEAPAFVLRPTSTCEKYNIKSICTEKDGSPDPDMDTFDFSRRATGRAFDRGSADVNSEKPLFVRISGAPQWFNSDSLVKR